MNSTRLRKAGLALLLLLGWAAATKEIADLNLAYAYAEAGAGGSALALRPHNPQAAIALAQGLYRAGRTDEAAAIAQRAIRAGPLHPAGLRLLGQARNRARAGAGNDLMLLAGQLGWRDRPTQIWLLQQAAMVGELDVAAQRAEALIRLQRDARQLFPLLRALSLTPNGRQVVLQALAQQPPWRPNFFEIDAAAQAPELNAMAALIGDLRTTSAPAAPTEARSTIDALAAARRFDEARALHRLVTGRDPAALPLHDGGFDRRDYARAAGLNLFDWIIMERPGSSASVEAPAAEGGNQILVALSDGRQPHGLITRLLLLRPGRYSLTYRVRAEDEGAAAARWVVTCAFQTPATEIMEAGAPSPTIGQWVTRSQIITVPASCPAQQLTLVPAQGAAGSAREIWFDDIAVQPA
jgi:tetratricopeptide (TPR) repeat protein